MCACWWDWPNRKEKFKLQDKDSLLQNPRGDKAGCDAVRSWKELEEEKLAFSTKRNSSSIVTGGKAERIHAFYIQMAQKNDCPPHSRLNTADPGEEKRPSLSKDQFGNRSQNLWPRTPPSGPSWGMSSERLTQICSQKLYLQEGRILHKDPQQRIGQLDYSKIVGRSAIKLAKVILWGRRI